MHFVRGSSRARQDVDTVRFELLSWCRSCARSVRSSVDSHRYLCDPELRRRGWNMRRPAIVLVVTRRREQRVAAEEASKQRGVRMTGWARAGRTALAVFLVLNTFDVDSGPGMRP